MLVTILSLEAASALLTYVGIEVQATRTTDGKIVELSVYDGFCTIHDKANKIKRVLGESFRVTTFTNTDAIRIKPVMREF